MCLSSDGGPAGLLTTSVDNDGIRGTTNGGASWATVYPPVDTADQFGKCCIGNTADELLFGYVYYRDSLANRHELLRTFNGGAGWTKLSPAAPYPQSFLTENSLTRILCDYTGQHVRAILNNDWGNGIFIFSSDYGLTWDDSGNCPAGWNLPIWNPLDMAIGSASDYTILIGPQDVYSIDTPPSGAASMFAIIVDGHFPNSFTPAHIYSLINVDCDNCLGEPIIIVSLMDVTDGVYEIWKFTATTVSWEKILETTDAILSISMSKDFPNKIWYVTEKGAYFTCDNGVNWVTALSDTLVDDIWDLVRVSPDGDNAIISKCNHDDDTGMWYSINFCP